LANAKFTGFMSNDDIAIGGDEEGDEEEETDEDGEEEEEEEVADSSIHFQRSKAIRESRLICRSNSSTLRGKLSYASVLVMPNLFIGSWEEAIGLALF
jgi:hypothetical protein